MTTRPEAFITSVEVRQGPAHDYVTIWIRHQSVGTLCVGKGDGEQLARRLRGPCPECGLVTQHKCSCRTGEEEARSGRYELTPWMRGALEAMRDPERAQCTRCPKDLQADERTLEVAHGQGFDDVWIREEVERFVDYHYAQGVARYDWQSLLRSWFRRRRAQLDDNARKELPFVLKVSLAGAPNVEPIPQQMDRLELARSVTRRLHATLHAEQLETERRMVESAGNWMAPVMVSTVRLAEISGHDPPPGNWALFEGPREVIDSLLAQHGYPTAEAGPGVPAPSPPAANEPEGVSRPAPAREPPAAGTPPTFDDDAWRDEETIG